MVEASSLRQGEIVGVDLIGGHQFEDGRARLREDEIGKPRPMGSDDGARRSEVGRLVIVIGGVVDSEAVLHHHREHLVAILERAAHGRAVDVEPHPAPRGGSPTGEAGAEKGRDERPVAAGCAGKRRGDEALREESGPRLRLDGDDFFGREGKGREEPTGVFRAGLGNEDRGHRVEIDPRRFDERQPSERIEEKVAVVVGGEVAQQAERRAGEGRRIGVAKHMIHEPGEAPFVATGRVEAMAEPRMVGEDHSLGTDQPAPRPDERGPLDLENAQFRDARLEKPAEVDLQRRPRSAGKGFGNRPIDCYRGMCRPPPGPAAPRIVATAHPHEPGHDRAPRRSKGWRRWGDWRWYVGRSSARPPPIGEPVDDRPGRGAAASSGMPHASAPREISKHVRERPAQGVRIDPKGKRPGAEPARRVIPRGAAPAGKAAPVDPHPDREGEVVRTDVVHRHELEDPRARPAEDEVGKPCPMGPDDDGRSSEVGGLVVVFSGVVDGKAMRLHQRDHLGTILEGAIPVHPVDIEARRPRRGRRCPEDVRPEKLDRLRGVATGHAWIGRGEEPLRS